MTRLITLLFALLLLVISLTNLGQHYAIQQLREQVERVEKQINVTY